MGSMQPLTVAEDLWDMSAKELRAAGKLWPENLSESELLEAARLVRGDTHPISARMLDAELCARRLR